MKIKSLFFFSLFFLNGILASAKQPFANDSIKKGKVILVSSSLGVVLAGSYVYIENSWWNEKQRGFHFDNGSDKVYALNVDKVGHFIGGMQAADIFSSSKILRTRAVHSSNGGVKSKL